jgi:hypothetical protein
MLVNWTVVTNFEETVTEFPISRGRLRKIRKKQAWWPVTRSISEQSTFRIWEETDTELPTCSVQRETVALHQCAQYSLRLRIADNPTCSVFHRPYRLTLCLHVASRLNDILLSSTTSVWMYEIRFLFYFVMSPSIHLRSLMCALFVLSLSFCSITHNTVS